MTDLKFKFQWVDENGNRSGMFSKKGRLDDENLTLDAAVIPVAAIASADVRGEYLILALPEESGEYGTYVIATGKAKQLKAELGRLRSAVWAEVRRKELAEQGRGHLFRLGHCPACHSTLDLTDFPDTPQISCDFCHTISTLRASDGSPLAEIEHGHRLCDECGMFSHPKQFTIFYFYFLVVIYGWTSSTTWRCPGCMRGEAWKMLFGNMLFVLGIPVALTQLFRCYGGANIGAIYPGLDGVNIRARNGDLVGAIDAYQNILERRPVSAGVKHNLGLAFLGQDQPEQAARMFEFALADCGNYRPSAAMLAECYERLGEDEKLAALKKIWQVEVEQIEALDARLEQ